MTTTNPEIGLLHDDRIYPDKLAAVDKIVAPWRKGRGSMKIPRDVVWNVCGQLWVILAAYGRAVTDFDAGNGIKLPMLLTVVFTNTHDLFGGTLMVSCPARDFCFAIDLAAGPFTPAWVEDKLDVGKIDVIVTKGEVAVLAEFLTTLGAVPDVFCEAIPLDAVAG